MDAGAVGGICPLLHIPIRRCGVSNGIWQIAFAILAGW